MEPISDFQKFENGKRKVTGKKLRYKKVKLEKYTLRKEKGRRTT